MPHLNEYHNLALLTEELAKLKKRGSELEALCSFSSRTETIVSVLEEVNEVLEKTTVLSRNTLEGLRPMVRLPTYGAPALPHMDISGSVSIIQYGWLYIKLNTLLPHCRFQTPLYLKDTLVRLLKDFEERGHQIPYYENAMLVIDEHCNIESRSVYDQDNKGYKAISNALKGKVFSDDDQFTLGISLVSTMSSNLSSHIFVMDANETGDFFNLKYQGGLYFD